MVGPGAVRGFGLGTRPWWQFTQRFPAPMLKVPPNANVTADSVLREKFLFVCGAWQVKHPIGDGKSTTIVVSVVTFDTKPSLV